jgi:hypothetical protein
LTEMDFKQSTKYVYFFFVLFLVLFYIINWKICFFFILRFLAFLTGPTISVGRIDS